MLRSAGHLGHLRHLRHLPLGGLLLCLLLLILDAVRVFTRGGPGLPANPIPPLLWLRFGYSALVAGLFLAVGCLTFWYARARLVAMLLFCFCFAMAATFAVQTGALENDRVLSAIGAASSALALAPFAVLLLLFPRNYLAHSHGVWYALLLRAYIVILVLLAADAGLYALVHYLLPIHLPAWWMIGYYIYDLIAGTGILATLIISYRAASLRERQQLRLFVLGVVVAFVPVLLVSVIPRVFGLLPMLGVSADSQFSTLAVIVMPVSLGFSILRYQILVNDASVRRAMNRLLGSIALSVLAYLLIALASLATRTQPSAITVTGMLCMACLAPIAWHYIPALTERLFFSEYRHYRRLLEQPVQRSREPLDLEETTRLLCVALEQAFETRATSLFILDNEVGSYCPVPAQTNDSLQLALRQRVCSAATTLSGEYSEGLEAGSDLVSSLIAAARPLHLSELQQAAAAGVARSTRYLMRGAPHDPDDLLLAPVWCKGEVIGILVLGERGDRQPYAGPDFEIISLILSRYASDLDGARLARDLRQAYERQKELDRLKDQFIMTASHELRTPLTAVQGYIELLTAFDQQLPPADRAAFLANASKGCEELGLILANIMDAGHMQSGGTEQIQVGTHSLYEVVSQSLEIFQAQVQREQRSVSISIPPDIQVMVDDFRLRQVILNLVSNALKYSSKGSPLVASGEIWQDKQAIVHIRDFGHGIPVDEQERLWERFTRLERDMNSPVRGAGLGLFITRQLIEAMGGQIWVESSGVKGEGSTFSFTLPLARDGAQEPEKRLAGIERG
jgi:signal transduction histidine kinase